MRLIDADALERHVYTEWVNNELSNSEWVDFRQWLKDEPTVEPASPWHRVEEKPKKHGKYPVCWVENGNFYWQEAHYCYYQDGDKWVAWSSYQGDDVEITPDYWMPIEPPKNNFENPL